MLAFFRRRGLKWSTIKDSSFCQIVVARHDRMARGMCLEALFL